METILIIIVGIAGGVASGLFGIGGAIIMIPALVFVAGFDQHTAQGTTLCTMVPPIGIMAAYEYYKSGYADIKTAAILAAVFIIGAYAGSKIALKVNPVVLKRIFGFLLLYISIRMIAGK